MTSRRGLAAVVGVLLAVAAALAFGSVSASAAPPYSHHAHITCNPHANEHSIIHCDGDGYLHNETVQVTLHTKTYSLGTAHTDSAGSWSKDFRLPQGVTGTHLVIGEGHGYLNGDPNDIASTSILITASGTAGAGAGNGNGNGAGGTSATGVAVLSVGVLALALLAGGTMFLVAGRRRQSVTA